MKKKKLIIGIREVQNQGVFRFRVDFIANGIESTGLAIGKSIEEVRDTYTKMNSEKESMIVVDVRPEN
jgi:hypothetical protein